MPEIDVAVVVVTYKSAQLTIDCLHSVERELATPGLRIRCIVVDNASGDSPAIAAAIERAGWSGWVKLITAERNGGFAYGNNIGIREAYVGGKPAYVHLLNPDTVLHPDAIGALVRFMEARPDVGIAGGIFENADASEWSIAFRFPSLTAEFVQGLDFSVVSRLFERALVPVEMGHEPQPVDWVSGASMMVRAQVLDAIGGLDEGFFLYFEETEFCFRAKAAGFSVWYAPESRVTHIAGQSTKVTERNVAARRLPAYWFASRRRYFAATRGLSYALFVDLSALVGNALGMIKRRLQGRSRDAVPHFLSDMVVQSLIWPRNRRAERGTDGVPRF